MVKSIGFAALKVLFRRKEAKTRAKPLRKAKVKKRVLEKRRAKPKKPERTVVKVKKVARKPKRIVKTVRKAKAAPKTAVVFAVKLTKAKALTLLKRKDATDLILSTASEEGMKVFEFLLNHAKEIDEFSLADKVKLQINFVRSLLYKLYELKLVSFSRERDKKKGWFIYSWQSHADRLKYILVQTKKDEIDKFEKRLSLSQDTFYCPTDSKSFDYVQAMETMFFCDVCGGKLEAVSSLDVRQKIQNQISELKKQIDEIEKI